jgi:hypothetical protein
MAGGPGSGAVARPVLSRRVRSAELRDTAYQNKRVVYDLLMKAAVETTLAIAADPKRLGARIAIVAVLHRWGSTLTHHPHVHVVVPGGGLRRRRAMGRFPLQLPRARQRNWRVDAHDVELRVFNTYAGLADQKTFKRFIVLPKTDRKAPTPLPY